MAKIETTAVAEFEAQCNECGDTLTVTVEVKRWETVVLVEPCRTCLRHAKQEGYDEGLEEGQEGEG